MNPKKGTVWIISYNISQTILTIAVLEFPPSESCSRRVSLEFLYGMWVLFPSTRAEMTFPRVERDRLILVASFSLCPVAPVLACLSEPCNIWMVSELSKTFFYLFDAAVYYWCEFFFHQSIMFLNHHSIIIFYKNHLFKFSCSSRWPFTVFMNGKNR